MQKNTLEPWSTMAPLPARTPCHEQSEGVEGWVGGWVAIMHDGQTTICPKRMAPWHRQSWTVCCTWGWFLPVLVHAILLFNVHKPYVLPGAGRPAQALLNWVLDVGTPLYLSGYWYINRRQRRRWKKSRFPAPLGLAWGDEGFYVFLHM